MSLSVAAIFVGGAHHRRPIVEKTDPAAFAGLDLARIDGPVQFVASGNAELGFVARSQLSGTGIGGSFWIVPQVHYRPIEQQAVLLTDTRAGREFMVFIRGDEAKRLIREHGYGTP